MQPNTTPTPNPTSQLARDPVPAELLETVARALAAALIPLPRQPEPPAADQAADFLTAAQLASADTATRSEASEERSLLQKDGYRSGAIIATPLRLSRYRSDR